eukprot:Awhi_evm1s1773
MFANYGSYRAKPQKLSASFKPNTRPHSTSSLPVKSSLSPTNSFNNKTLCTCITKALPKFADDSKDFEMQLSIDCRKSKVKITCLFKAIILFRRSLKKIRSKNIDLIEFESIRLADVSPLKKITSSLRSVIQVSSQSKPSESGVSTSSTHIEESDIFSSESSSAEEDVNSQNSQNDLNSLSSTPLSTSSDSDTSNNNVNSYNNTEKSNSSENSQIDILTQHLARLQLRLRSLKLDQLKMPDDGNCLFYAVSHQLFGNMKYHRVVRQTVVRYMQHHPENFAILFDDALAYKRYLNFMYRNGTWADELVILGVAQCFGTNVHIITSEQEHFSLKYVPDNKTFHPVPTTKQIFLAYISPVHYNSIIPLDYVVPEDAYACVDRKEDRNMGTHTIVRGSQTKIARPQIMD